MSLTNKIAIVTGASRGIGAAIALELAKRGADVAITYTSDSSASAAGSIKSQIETLGRRAVVIKSDHGSTDTGEVVLKGVQEGFGVKNVDILVLNAGISGPTPTLDWEVEKFSHMMNINVRGPMLLVKAIAPFLNPGGRIIANTSVITRRATAPQDLYTATKAALEGLVRQWAVTLPYQMDVTANAVAPGPVETEMMKGYEDLFDFVKSQTPVGKRLGTTDDIAQVVGFLAEEGSRWINGQCIQANGGIHMV
ncbi:MAG: hypothetical protein M1820_006477 [Bogoriella megaspora]|nr:MAG: hypothetical protein M1820_006477 [Bogoriella megaspora]